MKKLFSYDKFPQGRAGINKKVEIKCVNCSTPQFHYQKTTNGALDKLYLDSILDNTLVKNSKQLICKSCEKVLGVRISLGSINRLAFKLYPGSIFYKVVVQG